MEDGMLYNKTEAARLLRLSTKTVGRMVANGRLKACVVGGSTRIAQDALDQFIGSRVAAAQEKALAEKSLIPRDILKRVEREMLDVSHGTVYLTIQLRDHHPRFIIGREQSFLPEDASQGS
jgi:excisionase family DNA binding protein